MITAITNLYIELTLHYQMRKHGVSLFRHFECPGKWAACDDVMEFDYCHNGSYAEGDTPSKAFAALMVARRDKSRPHVSHMEGA